MSIDFRNPLSGHSALLTRLRSMLGGDEKQGGYATATRHTDPVTRTDRISLSDSAQRLSGALPADPATTRHDTGRVAAIRNAIESGTFNIDTSRIADKVRRHYGSL